MNVLQIHCINKLILQMQEHYGVTSVVVTHDMKSAETIADRIAFLHEGMVYFCGTPAELRDCKDPVVLNFVSGHSGVPSQKKRDCGLFFQISDASCGIAHRP